MNTPQKKKETAHKRYNELVKEVKGLLTAITAKVNIHTQADEKINWGHVGDMSSVKESLLDTAKMTVNYGN